jgi:transketolase
VPSDPLAVARLLPQVAAWEGPVYFRLCRNEVPQIYTDAYQPEIGKGITLIDGDDATIVSCGVLVSRSLQAAEQLADEGVHARVVEIHTVKPLDVGLLTRCARETGAIVTAEEHTIIGGLGGAVSEWLSGACPTPVERVGIADMFAETGPYLELLDKYGMSVDAIAAAVRRVLKRKHSAEEANTVRRNLQNA